MCRYGWVALQMKLVTEVSRLGLPRLLDRAVVYVVDGVRDCGWVVPAGYTSGTGPRSAIDEFPTFDVF